MSTVVSTFYKEGTSGPRAEVVEDNGYSINYYDAAGNLLKTENHSGHSLRWAEDAAENWALGIKNLNG
jgi:hypothetical protein